MLAVKTKVTLHSHSATVSFIKLINALWIALSEKTLHRVLGAITVQMLSYRAEVLI